MSEVLSIVGGCGHVGLAFGLKMAETGIKTYAVDRDIQAVTRVNNGDVPFLEEGAPSLLAEMLKGNNFTATTSLESLSYSKWIVVVIGTPIDEYHNPEPGKLFDLIDEILPYLRDNQTLILRSTIFPGITTKIQNYLIKCGLQTKVVYCPERILEGQALKELTKLPQLIGTVNHEVEHQAESLFKKLNIETVRCTAEEAELVKLFTNTWRYIKFAVANQFFILANEAGLEYSSIRELVRYKYERAEDLPFAGFAAGPCLFKDTMQLASFSNNNFQLGNSAMLVNEGLPLYLVNRMKRRYPIAQLDVGILGMSFKPESDDIRSSLSYKLKKILEIEAKNVYTSDPFVTADSSLLTTTELIEKSDLVIVATPHSEYKKLTITKPVIDIQNLLGLGSLV